MVSNRRFNARIAAFALASTTLAATATLAQTARADFEFAADRVWGQLVPAQQAFDCDAPSMPAQITLSQPLKPRYFDPTPFLKTNVPKKPVVIRRAGQTEQAAPQKDFQARFSNTFFTPEQRANTVEASLTMTLLFCEYQGLLDFKGAKYNLSGQLGNYRLNHQQTVAPDTGLGLSLAYTSRTWSLAQGGEFVPPRSFGPRDVAANMLGLLDITLGLQAEPLVSTDGASQLLADLSLSSAISVTKSAGSP